MEGEAAEDIIADTEKEEEEIAEEEETEETGIDEKGEKRKSEGAKSEQNYVIYHAYSHPYSYLHLN